MNKIESESLKAANSRKQSHLDLAFESQSDSLDRRFNYEPILSPHPAQEEKMNVNFGDKTMQFPIWISSMTGGTNAAGPLNKILAKTANKMGFGMGLGSCRIILEDDTYFEDFNLRPILGDKIPFYANIGIAQVEKLLKSDRTNLLTELVDKLSADGLIIHVNPLQEWLQPEGDLIEQAPILTIKQFLYKFDKPVIIKEVGQGFGPESMEELLKLPILAIEFAANGGTNFSKLELLRNKKLQAYFSKVIELGHSPEEMMYFLNNAVNKLGTDRKCDNIIVSGGIKNFLDGYYFIQKSSINAVYGQASTFLKYANESQEALDDYAKHQIKGLLMANRLLRVK